MARMLFLRDIDADVQLRCRACGHGGVLPRFMLERRFGPNYPVLSIAPHYRCSRCDSRDTESRPVLAAAPAAPANQEPAFDAPLAALQELLASIRGDDAPAPPPPASPPSIPPMPKWMETAPDAAGTEARPFFRSVKTAPPRPLEELVADGPADDEGSELWRPSSLAEMAAKAGGPFVPGVEPDGESDDEAPPPKPVAAPTGRTPAGKDEDGDETLSAMRRLLAQANWTDDALDEEDGPGSLRTDAWDMDEPDHGASPDAPAPAPPPRTPGDRAGSAIDGLPIERRIDSRIDSRWSDAGWDDPAPDDDDEDDDGPPVFSHKVLVRDDYEDEGDYGDEIADDAAWDDEPTPGRDARARAEDEPSDEDILSFMIRDPEKPAPRPERLEPEPQQARSNRQAPKRPAGKALDFDQHRAERRALRTPAASNDDEGFDKTLAALRSMIEDAAHEPANPKPRRKPRASPPKETKEVEERDPPRLVVPEPPPRGLENGLGSTTEDDGPEEFDDWARSARRLVANDGNADAGKDAAGEAGGAPAFGKPSAKPSAQEREIEEAMKALRGLVEEQIPPDDEPPPPSWPKPRGGRARPVPDATPPAIPPSAGYGVGDRGLADDGEKDADRSAPPKDATPLSKTIAALRGMLELDGRRKR